MTSPHSRLTVSPPHTYSCCSLACHLLADFWITRGSVLLDLTCITADCLCNAALPLWGTKKKMIYRRRSKHIYIVATVFKVCSWCVVMGALLIMRAVLEMRVNNTTMNILSLSLCWGCWRFGSGEDMVVAVFPQTLLGAVETLGCLTANNVSH